MMLTNYPLDRELVAARQRERHQHAERARRAREGRPTRPSRFTTFTWKLPPWLLHPTTRRGEATGPATA
jgi:hypothetical protein